MTIPTPTPSEKYEMGVRVAKMEREEMEFSPLPHHVGGEGDQCGKLIHDFSPFPPYCLPFHLSTSWYFMRVGRGRGDVYIVPSSTTSWYSPSHCPSFPLSCDSPFVPWRRGGRRQFRKSNENSPIVSHHTIMWDWGMFPPFSTTPIVPPPAENLGGGRQWIFSLKPKIKTHLKHKFDFV